MRPYLGGALSLLVLLLAMSWTAEDAQRDAALLHVPAIPTDGWLIHAHALDEEHPHNGHDHDHHPEHEHPLPAQEQATSQQDSAPAANRRELPHPIGMAVETLRNERVAGRIIAHDDEGLDIVDVRDQHHRVLWSQLSADWIYRVHQRILPRNDAKAWLQLGIMLKRMADGAELGDRALNRAALLDDSLADQVAQARHLRPALQEQQGPQTVGQVDPRATTWPRLTAHDQRQAVAGLKDLAERTLGQINHPMRFVETRYFLFYSDLADAEKKQWTDLLDRMYDMMCDTFDIPRGTNIWRGKCIVLVFSNPRDYQRYMRDVFGFQASHTAGLCMQHADGYVQIVLHRQPDRYLFGHVMVHETTHGFLHRYRSPQVIPSWANEGLAEYVGDMLVPETNLIPRRRQQARAILRNTRTLGDFFEAEHIQGWQYGVAADLTSFMIERNRRGYVQFIQGIKAGRTWQEALQQDYRMEVPQLVTAYGQSIGVADLQPAGPPVRGQIRDDARRLAQPRR